MTQPLMPMATAVWLVDNTVLTFTQISEFCGLHELEIQGIADGTVGAHIVGQDPTTSGQLAQSELDRCQQDPKARLVISEYDVKAVPRTKGPRYTPVSKRQDKPDAIAWLVRNHPELTDLQISRLVGTTKPTIQAIRERTHWNISNIRPQDPVGVGLCKQLELDEAVQIAAAKREKAAAKAEAAAEAKRPSRIKAAAEATEEAATEADSSDAEETPVEAVATVSDTGDTAVEEPADAQGAPDGEAEVKTDA